MDKKVLLDISRRIFDYILNLDDKDIIALYNKEKKLVLIDDKLDDNFTGEEKIHHEIIGPGPAEKIRGKQTMPMPPKNNEAPPVPDDIKGRFKIKPLEAKMDHDIEGPLKKHLDSVKKQEIDAAGKNKIDKANEKKADVDNKTKYDSLKHLDEKIKNEINDKAGTNNYVDIKSDMNEGKKEKVTSNEYAEEILKKLYLFQSSEEAYVYLKHDKKITIAVLKEAAKMAHIYIKSRSTKSNIIEKIVDSLVGSKSKKDI